jgi:hypothetical protein
MVLFASISHAPSSSRAAFGFPDTCRSFTIHLLPTLFLLNLVLPPPLSFSLEYCGTYSFVVVVGMSTRSIRIAFIVDTLMVRNYICETFSAAFRFNQLTQPLISTRIVPCYVAFVCSSPVPCCSVLSCLIPRCVGLSCVFFAALCRSVLDHEA